MKRRNKNFFGAIGFEFIKHFRNKATLIIILGLLLLNGWKICNLYKEKAIVAVQPEFANAYNEFYSLYKGEITLEKINSLLAVYEPIREKLQDRTYSTAFDPNSYTYNAYSDEIFLSKCFLDEMEYDYTYQNQALKIVRQTQKNKAFFADKNLFEYRKNQLIENQFQNRKISDFFYTEMYQYYFFYDYSALLVLIICIFGMAGVFVIEKETEMEMLLATSRNGGLFTTVAKFMAALCFAVSVCMAFWIEDFVIFNICLGSLDAAKLPLYALQAFQNTMLCVNFNEFALGLSIIKTVGIVGCCFLFLLFSSVCKNTLIPFLSSFILSAVLIYLQRVACGKNILKCFNPFELVMGRDLFKNIDIINVFEFPIPLYVIVIGSVLMLEMVICFLVIWINRRKR